MKKKREIVTVFISIIITGVLLTKLDADCVIDERVQLSEPFGLINSAGCLVSELSFDQEIKINTIALQMATYNRKNTCQVDFYLYKNGEEIYHYLLKDASNVIDNGEFYLRHVDTAFSPEDEVYLMVTSPNSSASNTITVWMFADTENQKSYRYNAETGEAEKLNMTPAISFFETGTPIELLYRSYSYIGFLAIPVCGFLLALVLMLIKELLPIELFRRKRI